MLAVSVVFTCAINIVIFRHQREVCLRSSDDAPRAQPFQSLRRCDARARATPSLPLSQVAVSVIVESILSLARLFSSLDEGYPRVELRAEGTITFERLNVRSRDPFRFVRALRELFPRRVAAVASPLIRGERARFVSLLLASRRRGRFSGESDLQCA